MNDQIKQEVYELYASKIGLSPLTDKQKQMALDAIIASRANNLSWEDLASKILQERRGLWQELAQL